MRIALSLVSILVASALVAGCVGSSNGDKLLAKGCERQIKQQKAEAGDSKTPEAESNKKRVDAVTLQECAGQTTTPAAASTSSDSTDSTSTGDSAGGDSGGDTKPVIDPKAKDLFTQTCGGCHALKDAGATGAVGPDLDTTKFTQQQIEDQIKNGKGAMPPGLLSGDDVTKVAQYIEAVKAG